MAAAASDTRMAVVVKAAAAASEWRLEERVASEWNGGPPQENKTLASWSLAPPRSLDNVTVSLHGCGAAEAAVNPTWTMLRGDVQLELWCVSASKARDPGVDDCSIIVAAELLRHRAWLERVAEALRAGSALPALPQDLERSCKQAALDSWEEYTPYAWRDDDDS